ncbi:hypothetical protein JCM16303_005874 [Sporobolomyces ruberrimus]
MTLKRLPLEIKEEIIQLVHRADQAYRRRPKRWRRDEEAIEGKGIRMLSLVNWECRRLTSRILFENVALQGVASIGDEPTAHETIKTLLRGNLTRFVTRLCPPDGFWRHVAPVWLDILEHFPNVRHLVVGSSVGGLLSGTPHGLVPRFRVFPHELSFDEQDRRIRDKFPQLASQITSWTLRMHLSDAEKILQLNPDKVEYLSLAGHPQLSNNWFHQQIHSTFHSLLSRLPNLKVLRVTNYGFRDLSREYPVDPHIHRRTFETIYPCAAILESLTLIFRQAYGSEYDNSLSLLRFAALFPSLRHLDLRHTPHEFTSEEIADRTFPGFSTLERFEFDCYDFDSAIVLLRFLDLPSLRHLTIRFSHELLTTLEPSCQPPFFAQLVRRLKQFKNLRSVYLETHMERGIPSSTISFLRQQLFGSSVEVKIDTLEGVIEATWPLIKRWKGDFDPPATGEAIDPQRTLEALTNGAEDLGKWVQKRAQELRDSGDVVGARKLMQGLLGIAQMKQEWED